MLIGIRTYLHNFLGYTTFPLFRTGFRLAGAGDCRYLPDVLYAARLYAARYEVARELTRSDFHDKSGNAPTSPALREQGCALRSDALATNSQFFTLPGGNPGEAQPNP
jgi:hypothetical protein